MKSTVDISEDKSLMARDLFEKAANEVVACARGLTEITRILSFEQQKPPF